MRRDAERLQVRQALDGRVEGALWRERADVELVDGQAVRPEPVPAIVVPAVAGRIDDLGRAVRPVRLRARARVRERLRRRRARNR